MRIEPPVYRFPEGVKDRAGRRLRPGSFVRVASGEHAGEVGEVVGWAGRGRVEVLLEGDAPVLAAITTSRVEAVAEVLAERVRESVTAGAIVVEESGALPLVVVPIGMRDVQVAPGVDLGPFPSPEEFTLRRGPQARKWGEACLAVLEGRPRDEAGALVAGHLDAPMLRRILDETALPRVIHRLVMVVSDQPKHHPFHPTDTEPFGRLLGLWVEGTAARRFREVREVVDPIVIRSAPHLVSAVVQQVLPEIPRTVENCDLVVVVHAGGTPAMTYGTMLAYTFRAGIRVRHVQVPEGEPILEIDFPQMVAALQGERG